MSNVLKNFGLCFALGLFGFLPAVADDGEQENVPGPFDHISCKNDAINQIRLEVTGIKRSEGLIVADIYRNDEEGFLRGKGRITKVKFAAKAPTTRFCITMPYPDEFAIGVYQDKNANGSFDKNAFGLPAEPWGLSNNPRIRFAPPKVEDSLISVTEEGTEVVISLN